MPLRLLVAIGAAAESAEQIPDSVRLLLDQAEEILVISPALPDRVHWLVSDTDKATSAADERLAAALGHLEQLGDEAQGKVGADDPLLAFADAIEEFHPDHILIGVRGSAQAGWQERGLVEKILKRFGLPVTVFAT
jgi:nucleotide-binding universal stress UspA family protein